MSIISIVQHMGLGDHIITNGLVRKLIQPYIYYDYYTQHKYVVAIRHMFEDLSNINIIGCDGLHTFPHESIVLGYKLQCDNWETQFYLDGGIDYEEKYISCHYPRHFQQEQALYDSFNIHEPYIFIHEDDRYKIDYTRLPHNKRIIAADWFKSDDIFNYTMLLEKADEIHMIESSFCHLVETFKLNKKSFAHRYAKRLSPEETPKYRNVSVLT